MAAAGRSDSQPSTSTPGTIQAAARKPTIVMAQRTAKRTIQGTSVSQGGSVFDQYVTRIRDMAVLYRNRIPRKLPLIVVMRGGVRSCSINSAKAVRGAAAAQSH